MSDTLRLALLSLAVGSVMGLLVLAAAMAAGQRRKLLFWVGGTVWGAIDSGLMLTDCLHGHSRGPISDAAFPIFFIGVALWPLVISRGQPRWLLRWLLAQLIMLVNLGPAFMVAVIAAMCTFT